MAGIGERRKPLDSANTDLFTRPSAAQGRAPRRRTAGTRRTGGAHTQSAVGRGCTGGVARTARVPASARAAVCGSSRTRHAAFTPENPRITRASGQASQSSGICIPRAAPAIATSSRAPARLVFRPPRGPNSAQLSYSPRA